MLANKKCVSCGPEEVALSQEEIQSLLAQVPGWELDPDGKAIERRFTFKNFKQALALVGNVAAIAEAEGHHPDIALGWGYAGFRLWTHSIGGLHENDFIMASKINALQDSV